MRVISGSKTHQKYAGKAGQGPLVSGAKFIACEKQVPYENIPEMHVPFHPFGEVA